MAASSPPVRWTISALVGQDLGVKKAGILPYLALAGGLAIVLIANWIFQLRRNARRRQKRYFPSLNLSSAVAHLFDDRTAGMGIHTRMVAGDDRLGTSLGNDLARCTESLAGAT